tara:strand:+ start:5895 stop:8873 length:2979 start_codon:yes stop_codon:yes gene_type:complete
MKKNYIFKGNKREGQQPTSYGNLPLAVASLYKVQSSTKSTESSFARAKNDITATPLSSELTSEDVTDFRKDETVNYLFGEVRQEKIITHAYEGTWNDSSLNPALGLPQYLHYFDLDVPDEEDTLYVRVTPNYNFYVNKLESLDAKTTPANQEIVRPGDYYAYRSTKIINDRNKTKDKIISKNEFAYKTDLQSRTYVESIDKDGKFTFRIRPVEKNNSFFKNYLGQPNYDGESLDLERKKFLSEQTNLPIEFWETNPTTFISQDKQLLDATNNTEKLLPYSVTVEANLNKILKNAGNSEFKRILQDLNLYETFLYNLADRHEKPFFSISDDGEADFTKINKDFTLGPQTTEVRRATAIAKTLGFALNNEGLISPISNVIMQSKSLKKLRPAAVKLAQAQRKSDFFDPDNSFFDNTIANIDLATGLKMGGPGEPNEELLAAKTDFIYTDHNENTTVTEFDAFIFASRMEQFVNDNFLSLVERVNDPETNTTRPEPLKNYAEVVCYSIERHRVVVNANGDEDVIFEKEYIIPASTDKDELIKLVDAGVNYDQRYVYRMFVHVISLGTGTKSTFTSITKDGELFKSEETGNLQVDRLNLFFRSYPDLRMMRIPVFQSQEVYVLDAPPVYPTSLVIPSRQDPTKVKLVLSDNVSGIKDVILPLFPENDNLLSQFLSRELKPQGGITSTKLIAQQLPRVRKITTENPADPMKGLLSEINNTNDPTVKRILRAFDFVFDTKSPVVAYEILRLEKAPFSYQDFIFAKRIKLDKAKGVGFDDNVVPNNDYYYCFRSINAHGYFSNPSPIVQVRVDEEEELHVAEVKPYAFPSEITPEPVYEPLLSNGIISVSLSDNQAIATNIGDPKYPNLYQLQFTAADENKLEGIDFNGNHFFKIRATSRATGRVIELNFNPKYSELDKTLNQKESTSEAKSKGFTGGDLQEVSNYFDMSTKALSQLFIGEEEFSAENELIEKLAEKIRNNKLDLQTLQSLIANYKKIK